MELATTHPHIFELPTEILCIIFWLACGPSPFENGAEHLSAYTEVPISHVCRRWRSTSLNYPKLWTTIIYDRRLPKMRRYQVVDHLKTYIRRAAGHPLDVRFASLQLYDEDNVYLMLESLLENSSTWHRITLTLPFYIFEIELIDRLRDAHAPLLESYEIEVCGYHPSSYLPSSPPLTTPILSPGSPRLTHLSFRTLVFPSSIPCSPYLTTIHIEALKYTYARTAFFTILRLPSLTNLSVGRMTFLDLFDATSGIEPIIARELVQFRCSAVAVARCIWAFLRAPKLEVLVLKGIPINSCHFPPAVAVADSSEGVANTFPSLRTVVVLDCEVQGRMRTNARDLANATKSVTNLLISSANPSISIFSSILYYHKQGVQLWPNLEFVALNLFETYGFFPSQIMDFLSSRSGLLHPRLKMTLSEDVASTWKDEDPVSWSTFLESGHYNQASPARAIADIARSFNPDGIFHQPPVTSSR